MKVVLLSLLFIALSNTGCVSTRGNSVAAQDQEVVLPENNVKMGGKKIKLLLTTKDATCKKSQSCKVSLNIQNLSDEDVDVSGLSFLLSGYSNGKLTEPQLTSSVDLETLANLEPNKNGTNLIIKGKDNFEKEIDLQQIQWKEMRSSVWKHFDLWKFINAGEYHVQASVGTSLDKTSKPQTEKIGETEVQFIPITKGADPSDYLALEFKEN